MHVFHADSALPYTYKLYETVSETQFFNAMIMVNVWICTVNIKLMSLSENEGKLFCICFPICMISMYIYRYIYIFQTINVVII